MTPPNVKKIQGRLFVKLARMNPRLSPMDPMTEILKGPSLSWRRPAITKDIPNTNTAMVKIHEVSARVQPNSFSRGAMKILQAYSDPNERFINTAPPPRHHRLIYPSALITPLLRGLPAPPPPHVSRPPSAAVQRAGDCYP